TRAGWRRSTLREESIPTPVQRRLPGRRLPGRPYSGQPWTLLGAPRRSEPAVAKARLPRVAAEQPELFTAKRGRRCPEEIKRPGVARKPTTPSGKKVVLNVRMEEPVRYNKAPASRDAEADFSPEAMAKRAVARNRRRCRATG